MQIIKIQKPFLMQVAASITNTNQYLKLAVEDIQNTSRWDRYYIC